MPSNKKLLILLFAVFSAGVLLLGPANLWQAQEARAAMGQCDCKDDNGKQVSKEIEQVDCTVAKQGVDPNKNGVCVFSPKSTPAQTKSSPGGGTKAKFLPNPLGTTKAPDLIGRVIKAALGVVGSIALLMFIYGGFMLLISGGSPERVTKGKNVLVWATIGLVVIFLSYSLVNFVIKGITTGGGSTTSGGSAPPPSPPPPAQDPDASKCCVDSTQIGTSGHCVLISKSQSCGAGQEEKTHACFAVPGCPQYTP